MTAGSDAGCGVGGCSRSWSPGKIITAATALIPVRVHHRAAGLLVFMAGLTGIGLGNDLALAPLAAIGSLLLLLGFLVFAVIIFRTRIAPKVAA